MGTGSLDLPELEAILDVLPTGVALIVDPGTITWANGAYFATTGRSPAMLGMDFHRIAEEDGSWSAPIRAAVDAALNDGPAVRFSAVRARHRDRPGGIYLDVDVQPLATAPGRPRRTLLIVRDVTDRAEEHLRAQLFYEAFRTSTNPMQLTDAEGVMVDVNPAFEKVYGYRREECVGRRPNLVRSRHTPPEVYQQLWADLRDSSRGYWSGEILNRDRIGRERPVLLSITSIRSPEGAVMNYLGVAVDLSEQRSWELRAAHGDRLSAVGQLAAGVAHEINTPLANIMLVTESLKRRTSEPWVQGRLETIAGQTEIAARIVRGLLDFARRDAPRTGEIDLVGIAEEAVRFVGGKQSADVEIELRLPPTTVLASADRGQIIQVLTNLLNNAHDAMGGRGTVLVTVRRRGPWAEVEVLDSGPGIPAEVMPHIFEPFFTTKPEGEGTGLGLAISHGIVASHHGTLTVRNVPGAGAAFLLALPIRPTPGSPDPA